MIWIATLCLLAVAAWLIFNGINERRWVQAHSDDETVAADSGFLPDFSKAVAKRRVEGDGRVPISEENTRFARAVAKVQEKTAKMGDKLEARAQAARADDTRPAGSAADEPDFFGRSVNKVRQATDAVGAKLDERMRRERMKGEEAPAGRSIAEEDGLFPSAVAWVSQKSGEVGERIAERAKRSAHEGGKDDSFFARAVTKVGKSMEKVEGKLDAQVASSHQRDDDMLSRVSKKVGNRVNDMDERILEKSLKINDIEERIINSGGEAQRRFERK